MGDIKAIETVYNGYRFRSRLEARWAVFFDAMHIKYEYECEGYERNFPDGVIRYLPDFYLPESKLFAEVKGVSCRGQIPKEDAEKMSWMIDFEGPCSEGIVMLGNLPDPRCADTMAWAIWRHDTKGIVWGYVYNDVPSSDWSSFDRCGDLESAPYSFSTDDDLVLTSVIYDENLESSPVSRALSIARQARFEYGETPKAPIPIKIFE